MATEWKPRRSPQYRMPEGPQNRSPAVMAQRTESLDSLDDFPTPKWATRALIKEVFGGESFDGLSCWEPTCGRGYMAATLAEYFLHPCLRRWAVPYPAASAWRSASRAGVLRAARPASAGITGAAATATLKSSSVRTWRPPPTRCRRRSRRSLRTSCYKPSRDRGRTWKGV